MLLPRLASAFSVIGALLLLVAQGIPMVANGVPSTSQSAITVTLTVPTEDEHDHEVELKEASKSAAARRRLYRANASSSKRATVPVAPAKPVKTLLPVVDQKDIRENHRLIADETLRNIHSECRQFLKNFYVRYDNPENRGLGGGTTIILSGNVPDEEFRALLVHECGHVIDTGAWKGTRDSGMSTFSDGHEPIYLNDPSATFYSLSWEQVDKKKSGMSEADFVSGYASWNAFEDFAETFAYYTLHREEFWTRAQESTVLLAKYRFMEAHIENGKSAATEHIWNGNVPWDITKLPYRWLASTAISAR